MSTPRCFIIRHGETEWSLNGRHTGTTELPLTENGERRMRATGKALVGDDRLINPKELAHIYVSPRHRAQRTLELLNIGCKDAYPWQTDQSAASTSTKHSSISPSQIRTEATVDVTAEIREWDYGDYEGLTSAQIRQQRTETGLRGQGGAGDLGSWDIWKDGCEGGEGPEDVTRRLDTFIATIRNKFHKPAFEHLQYEGVNIGKEKPCGDVLLVAHGHILRAFAQRWVGKKLEEGVGLLLEAGGVGTLSYEHHSIHEPAILLGGAFTVNGPEEEETIKS